MINTILSLFDLFLQKIRKWGLFFGGGHKGWLMVRMKTLAGMALKS